MTVIISPKIAAKIAGDDHGNITAKEVEECFANHNGAYATDSRPEHLDQSGNPALWFVAETNRRKRLKITFVLENGNVYLKSAYPATDKVTELFKRKTGCNY